MLFALRSTFVVKFDSDMLVCGGLRRLGLFSYVQRVVLEVRLLETTLCKLIKQKLERTRMIYSTPELCAAFPGGS